MTNREPVLSVIMGAYNAQDVIQQSILSLLSQSFKDFELIIINDGSSDATREYIEQIDDDRIIAVNQENQGLTKSLNTAISLATGEFIARQDADDLSLPTRFAQQIEYLKSHSEVGLVGSSTYVSNSKGLINEIFVYPSSDEELKRAIYEFNPFVHGSVMVRKSLLVEVGGYNEDFRFVQDYELWGRLVFKTQCYNFEEPLYVRFRGTECSEVNVAKTPYVEKIQSNLKGMLQLPFQYSAKQIVAKGVYPLIGFPRHYARPLGQMYRGMANVAKSIAIDDRPYSQKSLFYYPWAVSK